MKYSEMTKKILDNYGEGKVSIHVPLAEHDRAEGNHSMRSSELMQRTSSSTQAASGMRTPA